MLCYCVCYPRKNNICFENCCASCESSILYTFVVFLSVMKNLRKISKIIENIENLQNHKKSRNAQTFFFLNQHEIIIIFKYSYILKYCTYDFLSMCKQFSSILTYFFDFLFPYNVFYIIYFL